MWQVEFDPFDERLEAAGKRLENRGVEPDGDGWKVAMEYNTDILDAAAIERLALHYRRLLEAAVATPETPVAGTPQPAPPAVL